MALPELTVKISADTAQAVAGMDSVGDAANVMGRRLKAANDNIARTTRTTSGFGNAMRQAGFQIGDFATQVGAGTSASVALGQQLPQLIGGFGVLGAVIGAAVAILVPLGRELRNAATAGKDVTGVFGRLEPAVKAIGEVFSEIGTAALDFINLVVNNLDSVLIAMTGFAAVMAIKVVAGFVAATASTITFRTALASVIGVARGLTAALLANPFIALATVVAVAVEQLTRLNSALRVFLAERGLLEAGGSEEAVARMERLARQIAGAEEALARMRRTPRGQGRAIQTQEEELEALRAEYDRLAASVERLRAAEAAAAAARPQFDVRDLLRGTPEGEAGAGGQAERDRAQEERQAMLARLQESLNAIRTSQLTEEQELQAHLLRKKEILDQALAEEMTSREEHAALTAELERRTAEQIQAIDDAKQAALMTNAASVFGSLATIAQAGGKKLAGIAKAFGIAEALINTYTGATAALKLPFPMNIAAFAAVMARGLAAVASIASVNTNGAANAQRGGAIGRPTAPAPTEQAAAPQPLQVRLSGIGPSDFISGRQLGGLLDRLNKEAGDRGFRLMVPA